MTIFVRPFSTLIPLLAIVLVANPSPALSKKDAENAGALLFRDKGCTHCHGTTAEGTAKGPSLAAIRKTWSATKITNQIENGGQEMPSFKDSLSNDEVGKLVAYLRAKHRPVLAAPVPTSVPTPVINPEQ